MNHLYAVSSKIVVRSDGLRETWTTYDGGVTWRITAGPY